MLTGMSDQRQAILIVDARGLRCPLPVLRLAAAARGAAAGTTIELLADDPHAAAELAAFLAERGWLPLATEPTPNWTCYRLVTA